jgi:hypothetical protein
LWKYVIPHFGQFLGELELETSDTLIAEGKADRIARSLFARYYPEQIFTAACYVKVGSFGKGTAIRPRGDLDMLFVLPWDVYARIEALVGNKQSQLLQEVKRTLFATFPNTDLAADGQVVVAPFQAYNVDIVPAFRFIEGTFHGQYLTADTANGGGWRLSNPVAEYSWLRQADAGTAGKATHLIKMLKAWKSECNVEIKSVCLEILATVFVNQWQFRDQTIFYYDWMVRDFFAFMLRYGQGSWVKPAGIDERIPFGECWQSKTNTAYARALKACDYEYKDEGFSASSEWQKVFGNQFHLDWAHYLIAGVGA